MDEPPQEPNERMFYGTVSKEVEGPCDLDFIEAMVLSGIYPQDVTVCREESEEWNAPGDIRPALPPEPVKATPSRIDLNPMPLRKNDVRNVLIGAGAVAFIVIPSTMVNPSFTGGDAQSAIPEFPVSQQESQAGGGTTARSAANGFAHGGSNGPIAADLGGYDSTDPAQMGSSIGTASPSSLGATL